MSSKDLYISDSQRLDKILKDPKNLVFARTVVPVKLPRKTKKTTIGALYEYAEHGFLGDAITLTLANGQKVSASDYKLKLKNGLTLTYGQINGLAGDLYGTFQPISDGTNEQDRSTRFLEAYRSLAEDVERQPWEAMDILSVLQTEVDAVNRALKEHKDPSEVYAQLPDVTLTLQGLTNSRPADIPTYLRLAQINFDHFGADARVAYNTGHAVAIQQAIRGDLNGAYAMNAFADHFLEDSFAAGHLRTPRRLLHSDSNPAADLCAKFMHDEDNALGITVKNPAGESWRIFGDKRALDSINTDNKTRCVSAVQSSADEIYKAYQTKQASSPDKYRAWTHAPTLESANGPQTVAPLFTPKNERRLEIIQRTRWDFTVDWWYVTTVLLIQASGLWPPKGPKE